jgi:hypothetical protein
VLAVVLVAASHQIDAASWHNQANEGVISGGLLLLGVVGGCVAFTRAFSTQRLAVAILYVLVMGEVALLTSMTVDCFRYGNCP